MYLGETEKMITDPGMKHMLRSIERYHYASTQDVNPVVAARHNGYAVALVDSLRDLASDEQVKAATGTDVRKLRQDILKVQDEHEGMALKLLAALDKRGLKLEELVKKL